MTVRATDEAEPMSRGVDVPFPGGEVTAESWDAWLRWANAWGHLRNRQHAADSWMHRAHLISFTLRKRLGLATVDASHEDVTSTYDATIERMQARARGAA